MTSRLPPPATACRATSSSCDGCSGRLADGSSRRTPGYLIEVRPGELDLDSFIRLTGTARSRGEGRQPGRTPVPLSEALGLWRGEPLSDVPSPLLQRNEAPRLAGTAGAGTGRASRGRPAHGKVHDAVTAELRQLVAAHPHRERIWAQLMLALYRGGRPGEALAAYQQARRVLREDLGVDPGRPLQDLHQQILVADPALTDGEQTTGHLAEVPDRPRSRRRAASPGSFRPTCPTSSAGTQRSRCSPAC